MPDAEPAILHALRLQQETGHDVSLFQLLQQHPTDHDDVLAQAIDADADHRRDQGMAVPFHDYLEIAHQNQLKPAVTDAAIDAALLAHSSQGLNREQAVATLLAKYPNLQERIADTLALNTVMDQGPPPGQDSEDLAQSIPESDDQLDGYTLLQVIHRGQQGVVYQARQHSTDRVVAVKFLEATSFHDAAARERFEREVRLAARLRHPGIVTVHDSGLAHGRYHLVMEYVDGQRLDDYVANNTIDVAKRVAIAIRIARAVHAAHSASVIHGDLKPENILVDNTGQPKLLDFGMARSLDDSGLDIEALLTDESAFRGTLAYAAPEQLNAGTRTSTQHSDLYALGTIIHEVLAGSHPFDLRAGAREFANQLLAAQPPSPRPTNPALPKSIDTVLMQALQKDPADRYDSAGDFADDLEHVYNGEAVDSTFMNPLSRATWNYAAWMNKRRAVGFTLMVCIALILVQILHRVVIVPMTNWDRHVHSIIAHTCSPADAWPSFDNIRLIGIRDMEHVIDAAHDLGFTDVNEENIRSLRPVHGHIMKRLANVAPDAVAYDIFFQEPSSFDKQLEEGVHALRHNNVEIILAVPDWHLDENGHPSLAPALLESGARWGGATTVVGTAGLWRSTFIIQRGRAAPTCSLGLHTYLSSLHPGATYDIDVHEASQTIAVRFFNATSPTTPGLRTPIGETVVIEVSNLSNRTRADHVLGTESGDSVGWQTLLLPTQEVIDDITISMADVLRADDEQLGVWFAGKTIMVADVRDSRDQHRSPWGGGTRSGSHSHISLIDMLQNNQAIRNPRLESSLTIRFLAGGLGLLVARLGAGRPRRFAILLVACLLFWCAAAVASHWLWLFLWSPVVPILISSCVAATCSIARPLRAQTDR